VYYEDYLTAQNSEQNEESMEELYKDLIQSQEDDLHKVLEDDAKLTPAQEDKEISVPTPDSIDIRNDIDEFTV